MKFFILFLLVFTQSIFTQVNTEKFRKDYKREGFFGTAALNAGLNSGNSEFVTVLGELRLDLAGETADYFLISNYEFKEAGKEKIINKGFAHLRGIYQLNQQFFIEIFLQKEFNDFILLQDRNLAGAGLRADVVKVLSDNDSTSLNMFIGIGAMYENEKFEVDEEILRYNLIRLTNYVSLNWLLEEKVNIGFVAYYQPAFEDFKNYRITAEGNLNFLITKNLSFNTSIKYRYDSEPEGIIKNYDFELLNGIVVSF